MTQVKEAGEQLREIQVSRDDDCTVSEKIDVDVEQRAMFKIDMYLMPLIFILYST